jgi:hypothetical protein
MPTDRLSPPATESGVLDRYEAGSAPQKVAWTSLGFAILQSLCTAVAGMQAFRLLIGLGSLTFSSFAFSVADKLHADWLRIPMMALALAGTLMNLIVLLHVRHLRNRAAGDWRRRTRTAAEKRSEAWQWALSILTLLSIAAEEYFHLGYNHHL